MRFCEAAASVFIFVSVCTALVSDCACATPSHISARQASKLASLKRWSVEFGMA
jgi:hypothetical protein